MTFFGTRLSGEILGIYFSNRIPMPEGCFSSCVLVLVHSLVTSVRRPVIFFVELPLCDEARIHGN
jgi:hypothetical protein